MLGLNRRTRRITAKGLLALMSGVWLLAAAAPCVMAAPYCPNMGDVPCESMVMPASQVTLAPNPGCESLQAIDCQAPNVALTERVVLTDFTALPPVLHVTPRVSPATAGTIHTDPQRLVLRLSPPPLYLQHGAFLI